jgi:hypothetical protein
VQQIPHREDPFFFKAVGGPNRKTDFRSAQIKPFSKLAGFFISRAQRDSSHSSILLESGFHRKAIHRFRCLDRGQSNQAGSIPQQAPMQRSVGMLDEEKIIGC